MSKVFAFPQGSREWLNARKGLPTASRFSQIITPGRGDPSTSQEKLINELIAESLLPLENENAYVSEDMQNGMKLEAESRCCYELGYAEGPVTEVGFVLSDCSRYGGSPDALVGETGGVELKNPSAIVHVGYIRANVLPSEYKCQVHGYMTVTKRDHWDFFSYHRGLPPFRLRVERDAFTEKLAAELENFCAKYNAARVAFNLAPLGETPKT